MLRSHPDSGAFTPIILQQQLYMKLDDIQFIRGCLPRGRTKFITYKDQYAAKLLSWKIGDKSLTTPELRSHKTLAHFSEKPIIQDLIKINNGKNIDREVLGVWPNFKTVHAFRLTLDQWGDATSENDNWNQTSRRGHNLVLQLNFPKSHGSEYRKLGKDDQDPCGFISHGHPVKSEHEYTMAWSRIDLDLDSGVALIEEIQNDWLRYAKWLYQNLKHRIRNKKITPWSEWGDTLVQSVLDYYETHIAPLESIWAETTLLASLEFIRDEIGISRVYYHTWETGNWFKRIGSRYSPPRSIYTTLPKKFGFKRVMTGPAFILRDKTNRHRMRPYFRGRQQHTWWFYDLSPIRCDSQHL